MMTCLVLQQLQELHQVVQLQLLASPQHPPAPLPRPQAAHAQAV